MKILHDDVYICSVRRVQAIGEGLLLVTSPDTGTDVEADRTVLRFSGTGYYAIVTSIIGQRKLIVDTGDPKIADRILKNEQSVTAELRTVDQASRVLHVRKGALRRENSQPESGHVHYQELPIVSNSLKSEARPILIFPC